MKALTTPPSTVMEVFMVAKMGNASNNSLVNKESGKADVAAIELVLLKQ